MLDIENVNKQLSKLYDEIVESEIQIEYSDFIQELLHEFYTNEYSANSHNDDVVFYEEVI